MVPFVGVVLPFLVLILSTTTRQVDVEYVWEVGYGGYCRDLHPGQCCSTLPYPISPYALASFRDAGVATVTIRNLADNEVVAVWGFIEFPNPDSRPPDDRWRWIEGEWGYRESEESFERSQSELRMRFSCRHSIEKTAIGPGDLEFYAWDDPISTADDPVDHVFSGVSYIRLPTNTELPPDLKTSAWLTAQGMMGLAWGARQLWSPKSATKANIPRGETIRGGRTSFLHGTAYIGAPPRWRYPDQITVNGTEYHSPNTSMLRYESADGQVLDLGAQLLH